MIWFVLWVIFGIFVGIYASGKGMSGILFFILSLIISPLASFLIVFIVSKITKDSVNQSKVEGSVNQDDSKWDTALKYVDSIKIANQSLIERVSPEYLPQAQAELKSIYFNLGEEAINASTIEKIIEETRQSRKYQIFNKGSSTKAIDIGIFTSPDDISDCLESGYNSIGFVKAETAEEAIAKYTRGEVLEPTA